MRAQGERDRAAVRILFVCFGNICRSPMAEGLARDLATRRHPNDASLLRFSSAGVGAQNGNPPTEEAVLAMGERGIDIASHRARRATPDVVGACDLVLTMEERQRLWLLESGAETPDFVLLKLSEAAADGLKEGTAPGTVRERVGRLGLLTTEIDREGLWTMPDHEYEVPDPIGLSVDGYLTVAARLEASLTDLLRALLP